VLATELYLPMYTVRLDGFASLGWADRLRDNGYRPAWQVDVGDDHATAETVNRPGKVPATFISDSLPSRQTRSPWRKWWMSLSCTTIRPDGLSSLLCVDEKSQMRALDRSQPVPLMMVGMPERRTHDYARHGTTSLRSPSPTACSSAGFPRRGPRLDRTRVIRSTSVAASPSRECSPRKHQYTEGFRSHRR
jgi:hypothetical protein